MYGKHSRTYFWCSGVISLEYMNKVNLEINGSKQFFFKTDWLLGMQSLTAREVVRQLVT